MFIFLSTLLPAFRDCIRILLIGGFGQQLSFFIIDRCCQRRRSTIPLRIFTFVRSAILFTWDSWLALQGYLLPEDRLLFVFCNFLAPILVFLGFFWTYEGTFPVKVLISTLISEFIVSVVTLLAVIPVNLLEGRADYTTMQGRLHPFDLLLLILIPAFFFLILFLIRRILVWFQMWTPVHRKLWLCFHVLFWIALQMNVLFEGLGDVNTLSFLVFFQYQIAAILVLLGGILFFIFRYVRMPSSGASPFQEFLNGYAEPAPVPGRLAQGLNSSSAGSASALVFSFGSEGTNSTQKTVKSTDSSKMLPGKNSPEYLNYLEEVQKSFLTASKEHWCRDWKVNSVLSVIKGRAKLFGIGISFDFMGFSCGKIDSEDVASILYLIFRPLLSREREQEIAASTRDAIAAKAERAGAAKTGDTIAVRCAATQYFLIFHMNIPLSLTDVHSRKLHTLLHRYQGILTSAPGSINRELTIVLNRT